MSYFWLWYWIQSKLRLSLSPMFLNINKPKNILIKVSNWSLYYIAIQKVKYFRISDRF